MGRNGTRENRVVRLGVGRLADPSAARQPNQHLLQIHVLGSLRATNYLGESVLPAGRKARALLGYLSLSGGERVPRSRLSSLLWDRVTDRQARASFRQALRQLMSALGPLAADLIQTTIDTVRLDPRLCWVDAIAALSSEPAPQQFFSATLNAMPGGELLEDLTGTTDAFDQWLLGQRTRFSEHVRRLFENDLKQLDETAASPDQRAALARRVITFDPTHEGASRVLMRALADAGEKAQALREFERCRAALRTSLDVEPSSETRSLFLALKMISGRNCREDNSASSPGWNRHLEKLDTGRIRVGILPLRGEGSPRCKSLAFSLGQEIASALSRFRWFDVVAPASLTTSASGIEDNFVLQQQFNYVVEGDLSGDDQKVKISIRLLDVAEHARPVWSDHFDLSSDAFSDVNDLIAAPVVARINPVILFIEGQQKPRERSATALVLQAISLMYSMNREKFEEAGRLLSQAVERDPNNAMVAAWTAHWQVFYVGQGWASDAKRAFETAHDLALRAMKIDPENAEAVGIYAHLCAFLDKDFDSALHYFDRSLKLNPNLSFVWALSAATYCYIGEPGIALQRLDRARDLAPFDPYFSLWECAYTVAYTFLGDYEKAITIGRRAVKANPDFCNGYKPLIAALGHLGRREEAAPYISKLLALEPTFTVERFGKVYPIRKPEDRERYMQGLSLAGVPEA